MKTSSEVNYFACILYFQALTSVLGKGSFFELCVFRNGKANTILIWLDLLGVARACLISILKIFKSLPNYWHMVTYITSLEKHLESFSGYTLSFYLNLVKYRFNNISHLVFYGDLVYKLAGSNAKLMSRRARK